jgi:hypothetical protein
MLFRLCGGLDRNFSQAGELFYPAAQALPGSRTQGVPVSICLKNA